MDTTNIQIHLDSIKLKLESFEYVHQKLDSLTYLRQIDKLQIKLEESADIISNINTFYESAWTKLIIVITVIGIVIPIIIQIFQRLSNKEIFKQQTKDFESEMDNKIATINTENEKKFNRLAKKYQKEIDKVQDLHKNLSIEADGSTFYLQGRVRLTEKNYTHALVDFMISAEYYLQCGKTERALIMLGFVEHSIDGIKKKTDFDNVLENRKDKDWDLFISKFCTEENRGTYKEAVDKIKKSIFELDKR